MKFLLPIFLFPLLLFAQQPSHYTIGAQELEGIDIYDMLHARDGNYILATSNGLMRFDGYRFEDISCPDMLMTSIFNLVEDTLGNVFYHNLSGQIFKFHKGACRLFISLPDSLVSADMNLGIDDLNRLVITSNRMMVLDDKGKLQLLTDRSYFGALEKHPDGSLNVCSSKEHAIFKLSKGMLTRTHYASFPISSNTTITWTYNDGNGNTSTQTQDVVINDNTDPIADLVSLPTITDVCEVNSITTPTATDNCAGALNGSASSFNLPITANTTITWTYDDGNGNTTTQTQDVVIEDIDVAITQNGGMLSADQSGATYQWVDCDNSNAPVANETDQDFTPSASGNYAVEVTINGCTETSSCVSMLVTNINEATAGQLSIFPVPTTDVLNIISNVLIQNLTIHTMDGKRVGSYSQNTKAIDVSELASGMYLLVAITESGISQSRFIKE